MSENKNPKYGFLAYLLAAVILAGLTFLMGFEIGNTMYYYHPETGVIDASQINESYKIDGYHIYITDVKEIRGERYGGFTYPRENRSIFIDKELDPEGIYSACTHEKMHNLGINSEGNNHDMIYEYQDQVVDPTCLKLLYTM